MTVTQVLKWFYGATAAVSALAIVIVFCRWWVESPTSFLTAVMAGAAYAYIAVKALKEARAR